MEGEGCKLAKKRNKWKPYYFELRGTDMSYYKKPGDRNPKGVYNITYARMDRMTVDKEELDGLDAEYASFLESQSTDPRLVIYTPTRLHNVRFKDEETCQSWLKCIHASLIDAYGEAEFDAKTSASKSLEPLVKSETQDQWKLYKNVVEMLVSSGMIADISPLTSKDKIKEGYLHMRKDDPVTRGHSWKRYYYVMLAGTIYYYTSTKNDEYNGIINLKIGTVDIDEKYCKAGKWVFRVQTPMRTYILRAKHDGSMKEWLKVIDQACPLDSGELLWKKFDSMSSVMSEDDILAAASPVRGTKRLVFKIGKKNKKHKLKKSVITIGRDGSNTIVVDDECVSRAHCKIDITAEHKMIVTDMGSSRGTKLNGEKISCAALKAGDVISIGGTDMSLVVS